MGPESFNVIQTKHQSLAESLYDDLQANNEDGSTEDTSSHEIIERWDSEKEADEYHERKAEIQRQLTEVENQLNALHHPETLTDLEEAHIDTFLARRAELQQEKLAASANYPGDWTGLLRERMLDPTTKERFITLRTEAMGGMLSGEPSIFDRKPKEYQPHYQAQIDNYDDRVDHIFSHTKTGPASLYDKQPRNLGMSNIDQPGTIFTDAIFAGKLLSPRQKNMVEAHEKGHGLRDYTSPLDIREIRTVIDQEALDTLTAQKRLQESRGEKEGHFRSGYVEKPEEIIERMAQFKNYFGMDAHEQFTAKHLAYVREHYVADTELDNGVTDLLSCITPKTEAAFLRIINKYPI